MNIAILIFTFLIFICSFIPFFGMPFIILFSLVILISYLLTLKRKNIKKEQKDVFAISLVVVIVSIVLNIVINCIFAKDIEDIINKKIDYSSYYEQKFNDYKVNLIGDEINIDGELLIKVIDHTNDGNEHYIKLNVEAISKDTYYSAYDFILYDKAKNEIYYPSYYEGETNFMSGIINNEEIKSSTLKYEINDDSTQDNLYLIYVDDENGVKIEL